MVPWSHRRTTYLNEYLASVQIEKKKGISDGLFLDCSYLPLLFPPPSMSLYDSPQARQSLFLFYLSFALLSTPHRSLKGAGVRLKRSCYV